MLDTLIRRGRRTLLALSAGVVTALVLSGCGGGSGAGAQGAAPDPSTTPPPSGGTQAAPTVSVEAYVVGQEQTTTSISVNAPAELRARVLDAKGRPIPNIVVTFNGDSTPSQVSFQPAPTSLTDASGLAKVIVAPTTLSAGGAETVVAQAVIDGNTVSGTRGLAIGSTDVSVTSVRAVFASGATAVPAYGTATIQASVSTSAVPVTVAFSSNCVNAGRATITAQVQTVGGVATATYTDKGCAGTDTITAQVAGRVASSSTQLPVQAPAIANLQFLSAAPATIALAGTGAEGLQQTSTLTFRVVDQAGNPVPVPQDVDFALSTSSGGILLDNTAGQTVRKQTGSDGTVQVRVQAGTLPTPVWVIASLPATPSVPPTQSTRLTISTGRPTQARFSLSASVLNINGLNYDGATSQVNIYAADRLGNPVADGTVINFISEGASVQPSCATTGGGCSVTFRSQNSRPERIADNARSDRGRVTITAYTVGEESFVDQNGDNVWQPSEPYEDLGFVYVDPLEIRPLEIGWSDAIGAWTPSRVQFIPFAGPLAQDRSCPQASGAPSMPGTCDGTWGTAHVRRDLTIVLSGNAGYLKDDQSDTAADIIRSGILGSGSCTVAFNFFLQDVNGNPMPAGTTFSGDTSAASDVSVTVFGSPVPSTTVRGGTAGTMVVKGTLENGVCTKGSGTVMLHVDAPSPNALRVSWPFSISPPPPPAP